MAGLLRSDKRRTPSSLAPSVFIVLILIVGYLSLFSVFQSLHLHDGTNPVEAALHRFRRTQAGAALLDPQGIVQRALRPHARPQGPPVWPVEDPVPNPPKADGASTFSACLLVMDDNHRLMEWFAYHFHVLPLRYVIVVVDPRSKTSPSSIFNEWRRKGVYIEEWVDRDFWRPELKLEPIPDEAVLQVKRDRHRGRQKYFYRKCLINLKENNRTWVALNDSDEYIIYNHKGGDAFEAWQRRRTEAFLRNRRNNPQDLLVPSRPPPTTAEAGAMIRYIRQEQAAGVGYYQSPCIGIPRTTFGAAEGDAAALRRHVPPALLAADPHRLAPAHQLDTIRFRRHAARDDFVRNALGKVIMDVSRIDVAASPKFMSLHRPIKTICASPWHKDAGVGLRINHYLGSWESYTIRDDCRRGGERSWEQWEYKATTNGAYEDDLIQPWLQGFVEAQGTEEAVRLLEKAGLPEGYKNTNIDAWRLHPDKLKAILETPESLSNDGKQVAFDRWVRAKYGGGQSNITSLSES